MKVYLDDERKEPEGWIRCYTAQEAIDVLRKNEVRMISLDHDLGDYQGNGNDVLLFIEEQVHTNPTFNCPRILIHTANPSARVKMKDGVKAIYGAIEK